MLAEKCLGYGPRSGVFSCANDNFYRGSFESLDVVSQCSTLPAPSYKSRISFWCFFACFASLPDEVAIVARTISVASARTSYSTICESVLEDIV
jgi:hypothetical protein